MGGACSEAPPILITTTGGGDNDARTPGDSSDGGTTEHGPPDSTPGMLPPVGRPMRMFGLLDRFAPGEAATYAAARSLLDWHTRHRFCANCGHAT